MSSPYDVKIFVAYPHALRHRSLLAWFEYSDTLEGKRDLVRMIREILAENNLQSYVTPQFDIVVALESREDYMLLTQNVLLEAEAIDYVTLHYAPHN